MAKTASLHIRVEEQIKAEAEQIFRSFGISVTDAINMFLHKSVMVRGIPFDIRLSSDDIKPPVQENELLAEMDIDKFRRV